MGYHHRDTTLVPVAITRINHLLMPLIFRGLVWKLLDKHFWDSGTIENDLVSRTEPAYRKCISNTCMSVGYPKFSHSEFCSVSGFWVFNLSLYFVTMKFLFDDRSYFWCIIILLQPRYIMQYVCLLLHMFGWLDLATFPIITSERILVLHALHRWLFYFVYLFFMSPVIWLVSKK